MLTVAFGKSSMSRTQVQLWYNRFKEGREDFNEDDRLVARVHQQPMEHWSNEENLIFDNRRITIRDIADDVGISYVSFTPLGSIGPQQVVSIELDHQRDV